MTGPRRPLEQHLEARTLSSGFELWLRLFAMTMMGILVLLASESRAPMSPRSPVETRSTSSMMIRDFASFSPPYREQKAWAPITHVNAGPAAGGSADARRRECLCIYTFAREKGKQTLGASPLFSSLSLSPLFSLSSVPSLPFSPFHCCFSPTGARTWLYHLLLSAPAMSLNQRSAVQEEDDAGAPLLLAGLV